MRAPRILLVDDHAMLREGVRLLLEREGLPCELFEAGSCEAALQALEAGPDIDWLLLDLELPDARGIVALDRVRTRFPGLRVVVLSAHQDRALILECINRGAMGFIVKASDSHVFVSALRLVLAGGVYLPPSVFGQRGPLPAEVDEVAAAQYRLPDVDLTDRQRDVLSLLVQGLPNKAIAKRLDVSEATVKSHVAASLKALKVRNRTQAVFVVAGLARPPEPGRGG